MFWKHAAQMAVLSLVPHTDKPAVPEDGDGAEHGDGGATQPAQVIPVTDQQLPLEGLLCKYVTL